MNYSKIAVYSREGGGGGKGIKGALLSTPPLPPLSLFFQNRSVENTEKLISNPIPLIQLYRQQVKVSIYPSFNLYCMYLRAKFIFSVPGPPSNVHAVPVSIKTIRVLWDPPIEPNGIITAYRLFYSKAISDPLVTNADKVTEVSIAGNYTSKILAKLESITEYFFWVKASTSVGFGNASVVVRQTTMEKSECFYIVV